MNKSNHAIIVTAIGILACLVSGCASPKAAPVVDSTATTAAWKSGEYTVSFRAGPGSYEKSYSHYEISRKFESDSYVSTVVAESPLMINSFRSGYYRKPEDNIQLFTSSSGKTLLIVEDVPNDCCPCRNWIIVRGVEGDLVYDYLNVPSREVKNSDDFEEHPQIIKVTENEITYRYSDGKRGSSLVKDIVKKEKRPTFPG